MEKILFNLTLNSRDIGGVKTPNGKIKHRVVIRSDALVFLSEDDKKFLLDNNIKTQIDLRAGRVLSFRPSSLLNDERFTYFNFPLVEGSLKSLEENDSISALYLRMIENKEVFRDVFKTFINVDGGVIINCTAGKDRTGIVIYMMLSLLGVDFKIILNDYVSSDRNIRERLPIVRETIKDFPKFLGEAKEEYLINFNKSFIKKYQSVENYLLNVGLTIEEINQIKRKLLGE
ncbi:MAG: tyrosine-protein phosphatase [Erysipelotrichaceae bacterium]|nr:tyrosine-protein phosphatase [Erysipelotrichaceae bacterium]